MTRPTIFLVLIALTLVVVSATKISAIKALGDSPKQPGNDALRGIHEEINKIADRLDPKSEPWSDLPTNNPYEAYEGLETCKENLKNCNGKFSTCDADLSACKTNNSDCSACNAAFSDCETNHTTCRFDLSEARSAKNFAETQTVLKSSQLKQCRDSLNQCEAGDQAPGLPLPMNICHVPDSELTAVFTEIGQRLDKCEVKSKNLQSRFMNCEADLSTLKANLAAQQETNEELVQGVRECQEQIVPTSTPDCSDHSAEEKVECETCKNSADRLIRRQRNMCELRLENQQSRFMEVIQRIVGSRSTQAPTPTWQGPPAPDYTRHFCIFWLVVLVCFGFRIWSRISVCFGFGIRHFGHLMVREKTSAASQANLEQQLGAQFDASVSSYPGYSTATPGDIALRRACFIAAHAAMMQQV